MPAFLRSLCSKVKDENNIVMQNLELSIDKYQNQINNYQEELTKLSTYKEFVDKLGVYII